MAGRKDSRGRNLHTGESQRKDGSYMYRYTDKRSGKRLTVYAGDSHSTIKLIHALLYPALERAADDDIIRKNPAKNALSGSYGETAGERGALTLGQQEKLSAFMRESGIYNAYGPKKQFIKILGTRKPA